MRIMYAFQVAVLDLKSLALGRIPAVALGRDFLKCAADALHMVNQFVQEHRTGKFVGREVECFVDVDTLFRLVERLGGTLAMAEALRQGAWWILGRIFVVG